MKIWYTPIIAIVFFAVFSCNSKADKKEENSIKTVEKIPELKLTIDSVRIAKFYENYPKLDKFKNDVTALYQKNKSTQLWQDNKGIVEFANTLFNQYKNLDQEGLKANYPYNEQLSSVFDNNANTKLSKEDTDLLLSNLYYYYGEKIGGFDEKTVVSLEWLLPLKKLNYQVLSDSIFKKSTILDDKKKKMFSQYYKLRDALKEYREIEKNGGWKTIEVGEDYKSLKVGDSSTVVAQIRERLFVTKDIQENNKSAICDTTLIKAMKNYELRHGYTPKNTILLEHINDLNISVSDRIKTIIVNMERCRWIDPELEKGQKYIEVNIPEFRLYIVEDGKIAFVSPVVVGRAMTKTVIFSGMMSNIVFSPYWNEPPSIRKS